MTEAEVAHSGDDRPPVYYEEATNTWVIRASALGGCLTEMACAGQGYDRVELPAVLKRAFAEGHAKEQEALDHLTKRGWSIWGEQTEYDLDCGTTSTGQGIVVRCHPDALGIPPIRLQQNRVLEVKWLSDANWRKAMRGSVRDIVPEYAWQASVEMLVTGFKLAWVVGNKGIAPDDAGVKAYCEDEGRIELEYVNELFVSKDAVVARAQLVMEIVLGDDVVQSQRECDEPQHFPCLYRHLVPERGKRSDGEAELGEELVLGDEALADEFNLLVERYVAYKGTHDEAKRLADESKAALLRFVEEHGSPATKVAFSNKWKVPVVNGRGQSTLDFGSMSRELKEVLENYRRPGKPYRYFRNIERND